jgi:hypothetical protein
MRDDGLSLYRLECFLLAKGCDYASPHSKAAGALLRRRLVDRNIAKCCVPKVALTAV